MLKIEILKDSDREIQFFSRNTNQLLALFFKLFEIYHAFKIWKYRQIIRNIRNGHTLFRFF